MSSDDVYEVGITISIYLSIYLSITFCSCLSIPLYSYLWYFDLRPGPKMLFQGDAPEGSDTFQWPVIERDRVGGLSLIIWDKLKVPLCHYRVMHRKRVASELHDSYFRLMTIKHSISKIEWASNDYITQLSSTSQEFQTVGGEMW